MKSIESSRVYNFIFHPEELKGSTKTLSICTNLFISIITASLWQIPFWIINRWDNKKISNWTKLPFTCIDIFTTTKTIGWTSTKAIFTLIEKVKNLFCLLFGIKHKNDTGLVLTDKKIASSEQAWILHAALVRDAYNHTENPQLKRQYASIIANYLGTAAPSHIYLSKQFFPQMESYFQVNPHNTFIYHRYGFLGKMEIGDKINESLAMNSQSPFLPTDTDEFEEILPLSFSLLKSSNRQEWKSCIKQTMLLHISSFPDTWEKIPLPRGFLFDLSNLKEFIYENDLFKNRFNEIKEEIKNIIAEVIQELKEEHTLSEKKLSKFIYKNSTAICRVKLEAIKVTGIKILPLLSTPEKSRLLHKTHASLLNFLSYTGLFIGAVNLRNHWEDFYGNNFLNATDAEYAVKKGNPNALYFNNKEHFLHSMLFLRLCNKMQDVQYQTEYSEVVVMMRPLLQMLNGLLQQISEDQWDSLNDEGTCREILQTTLFKLREYLATAELYEDDFSQFTSAIELAYAELGILLELTHPFQADDFSEIYKTNLESTVPSQLQPHITAGLGRTGVNLFALTNAALMQSNQAPLRVYGKGFYFEQVEFIGHDNKIENVLNDPQMAKKVDLYACQFNPNINIETDHTHYQVPDIAGDIHCLLENRDENDPPLTVTLDCTIDYVYCSEKVKNLLKEFQEPILQGKLNFVFFRSGQKLDMFGLDHYYGAPFFMVNNGDPKWKPFKDILQSPAGTTDRLSQQWFCLSNRYAFEALDAYRKAIFENTRHILNNCPSKLTSSFPFFTVNTADDNMEACFIDIKVKGAFHKLKAHLLMGRFYLKCQEKGIKADSRASFGFNNPNFIIIEIQEVRDSTTIRLNPGINPRQNEFIIDFLRELSEECDC